MLEYAQNTPQELCISVAKKKIVMLETSPTVDTLIFNLFIPAVLTENISTQHTTVEVCPTPDKTWTCIWQHRKHYGDYAAPQKRHTSQHTRKILYTQGILK
jgi:hypothetical protein